jgi:hypothetical protein
MDGKKVYNKGFSENKEFVLDIMLEVAAVEEVAMMAEETASSGKRERPENRFGQFERVWKRVALGEKLHLAQEATVFVAETGACYNAILVESAAEHFQVYHKVFPGLKTTFDLPIECFLMYEKLLEEEGTLVEIVNFMLRGPVAESTAKGYKSVVNRFHAFCEERGYTRDY